MSKLDMFRLAVFLIAAAVTIQAAPVLDRLLRRILTRKQRVEVCAVCQGPITPEDCKTHPYIHCGCSFHPISPN